MAHGFPCGVPYVAKSRKNVRSTLDPSLRAAMGVHYRRFARLSTYLPA